jgi:organic anion transporter 4A
MTPKVVVNANEKSLDNNDATSKYKLYGWKNFRIGGILSRPLFAYIILCTCNFLQNFSVNGANNAVISTLERVFYLDSVQSGLFLALYDLATVFSSPLVGYLGTRYSSPIFFSLNMIIVGVGNMLIASSNFVYRDTTLNYNPDVAQYLQTYNDILFTCYKDPFNDENITDTACLRRDNLVNTSQNAKFVLYLGNFINGIGSVALFTIGITYIERIFSREKAAYCQGIYFAIGTVGGALGIIATGQFLLIYTNLTPKKRLPPWLTPSHPLWIGCWWLPYIIYGGLCLLIGLFVSGLPNFEKPGQKNPLDILAAAPPVQNDPTTDSKEFSFTFSFNKYFLFRSLRSFNCSARQSNYYFNVKFMSSNTCFRY